MMAKPKNIHLFLKLVENIFCTNEVGMVVIWLVYRFDSLAKLSVCLMYISCCLVRGGLNVE
jgi:hypothetical protein